MTSVTIFGSAIHPSLVEDSFVLIAPLYPSARPRVGSAIEADREAGRNDTGEQSEAWPLVLERPISTELLASTIHVMALEIEQLC